MEKKLLYLYSTMTITSIIEHKSVELQMIKYAGSGIMFHTQFYTGERWKISVKIAVKLSAQQPST